MHLFGKLSKELKYNIGILVGQVVSSYGSKHSKYYFNINNSGTAMPKCNVLFEFLGQFTIKCILFFKKGVDNF